MGDGNAAGIDHVNSHRGPVFIGTDQPLIDSELCDACQQVAAILAVTYFGLVDHDLQEQVIHVRVSAAGWADYSYLAG